MVLILAVGISDEDTQWSVDIGSSLDVYEARQSDLSAYTWMYSWEEFPTLPDAQLLCSGLLTGPPV